MAQQQTSTDYDVDNRYRETRRASDNREGKHFLKRYINSRKAANKTNLTAEREEDGHFVMSAPGLGTNYSVKNEFNAENSPAQRRVARLNQ